MSFFILSPSDKSIIGTFRFERAESSLIGYGKKVRSGYATQNFIVMERLWVFNFLGLEGG